MAIDAKTVAALRETTGAGMMAAKKALEEASGDLDKATALLQKAGAAKAAKRSGRSTGEGLVYSYIHSTGKLGVLLELQSETDFVARNDSFKELAHQLAMHIAASNPRYLDVEGVPADELEKVKGEFAAEASGKPEDVVAKIVEGKIAKWQAEAVLLKQPFVMDEDKTIEDLMTESVAKIGENLRISRFARFEIEGNMTACESVAPEVTEEE